MTREQIINDLITLEQRLATRVRIVRIIIDENGKPTGQRIVRGSFQAPRDWKPPAFTELMKSAKKGQT